MADALSPRIAPAVCRDRQSPVFDLERRGLAQPRILLVAVALLPAAGMIVHYNSGPSRQLAVAASPPVLRSDPVDEFLGPFATWDSVKTKYGARGDGLADDTEPLQRALNGLGRAGNGSVVFIPAGKYRITKTLQFTDRKNVGFIGEDPATTMILWGGAKGGKMMSLDGVTLSR